MTSQLKIIAICLVFFWINTTQSKTGIDVEVLLDKIFNSTIKNPVVDEYPEPIGKICGLGKECVQRTLCKADGTVKIFGEDMLNIRIDHENPCSYLETCCNVLGKLTQPPPDIVPDVQENGCGTRNSNGVFFKISGAQDGEAEFAEFPWMVAIYTLENTFKIYKCGGAVIAPNVVLTAAHCVWNQEATTLIARAGEWDTQTNQEPQLHQDVHVKEIISHEGFNPSTIANDIALLILEIPYIWAPNVQPICLPTAEKTFDHSRCIAAGWGKDKFGKGGLFQVILKKIELPIVPHDTCQANLRRTRLSRFFQLDKSFICAGGEKGKDTCKGDGGSPLVCPDPQQPDRYYQAGIVSWGVGCGEENIPGVYANVPYLRGWINEKLRARGVDFKHFTA
ncbi:PREDICTED: tryptase-like [Rhagoletis zephyria]|uniref:tryptase-like n=1 Tax=Rhagoletis zephyria TaxID=28612 RepID=UPI00081136AE|nr:PREDICTED: tryptase-like [Rhagoletis zephyria]